MLSWFKAEWHKIGIGCLMLDHLCYRLQGAFERFKGAEEFVERRITQRRKIHMPLFADAALIERGLTIAPELIPQLAQVLADINKLMADITSAVAADAASLKGTTPPTPPAAA